MPSQAIRTALAESGGRCAFPGCEESPNRGDFSGLEVAHIRALRPGGPRFDSSWESNFLQQPDNLIVFCPYHHMLVDLEPSVYTAEKLLLFKTQYGNRGAGVASNAPESPPVVEALPISAPSWVHPAYVAAAQVWTFERSAGKREEFWQQTLTMHPILLKQAFGIGACEILDKCYVGGKELTNTDGKLVDFMLAGGNNAIFVEIKKPDTPLLLGSPYRSGIYGPSVELAGAIVQVLTYRQTLAENPRLAENSVIAGRAWASPCIVLAGDIGRANWSTAQRRSFELFRNGLKDVRVKTYDELFDGLAELLST